MPPRIPVFSSFGSTKLCIRLAPTVSKGPLPTVPIANASSQAQRRKHRDPYALAQARQRKAANLKRQDELKKEREAALGDPVRGIATPFVESLDSVGGAVNIIEPTSKDGTKITSKSDALLNHFLTPEDLEQSLKQSYEMTKPIESGVRDLSDPALEAEERRRHQEGHERAVTAISRIVSLANASQVEKTRANIRRCIDTFGRHNTDTFLKPRAPAVRPEGSEATVAEKTPRAGPDTGSSEVQIAILTAKIRVLANALEAKGGNKDKVNKRNLRLLVHRRQKLLQYLRRKERGSERWQNLVTTLGLTEGTWKGEISL
ncbi:ribosomal protein-like protein S15 [Xylogone sp. PMI_703]|nr:ribosomal protein-like protein S15 [Xylogone sp. PMI_703]